MMPADVRHFVAVEFFMVPHGRSKVLINARTLRPIRHRVGAKSSWCLSYLLSLSPVAGSLGAHSAFVQAQK
jgi:hypothetical protein